MATNATKTNETTLRDAFRKMDAYQVQEIRNAYYKAVEGLRSLADALESADNPGPASDLLISEHLIACQAMDAMKNSQLGAIL